MLDLDRLAAAVRYEGGVSRRLFLALSATLAGLPQRALRADAADRAPKFTADPFTLGVASGDPEPTSVVIWTRLAPQPLEPAGGMPPEPLAVRWEVAHDDQFQRPVAQGDAIASPQLGHSVHVTVRGLEPDRWYFYRFKAGDAQSPVGRTRTAPADDAEPDRLRFAFASCQHYEQGLYTAYEQMARDELDLIFHLGDYIYEYAGKDGLIRKHHGAEINSLDDYRARHAQYRSDRLLQTAHARCPWLVVWDDHEFDNNCADDISEEKKVDPGAYLERRANAYQAYYEAMPLRERSMPRGPDMQLYRPARFGRLAQFLLLDTRQYRSDQPNDDKPSPLNEAALDSRQSILGRRQRGWLEASMARSRATWNVLAQQVMMGMVSLVRKDVGATFSMDQWPGYAFERMSLLRRLAQLRTPNLVTIAGDIHSNWANELRIDDRQGELPVVATEFVATSISSGGNGLAQPKYLAEMQAANPFVKFHTTERGYVRCDVDRKAWKTDFVAVEDVKQPGGAIVVRQSLVVEAGRPKIEPA